jgi:rhomboid-like protein
MLRSQWRKALPRVKAFTFQNKRSFTPHIPQTYFGLPPVRVLGPTLWVFSVASTIYLGCAAYEVHQNIQETKKRTRGREGPLTFKDIEVARINAAIRHPYSSTDPVSLSNLTSAQKMIISIMGANVGIFATSRLIPGALGTVMHVPAGNWNFTLLSSMFGHGGLMHLGFNMYALLNFGQDAASSPTFASSGPHLTAFYLSSGLVASLAHHLTCIWPNPTHRLVPALGASGAIMAILGAWAMNYPDARIGVILIPGSMPAKEALWVLIAFESWGLFVGYRGGLSFLSFAHAAHLAGLGFGAAYVHFDGKRRLWQPARKVAWNGMRRLGVV